MSENVDLEAKTTIEDLVDLYLDRCHLGDAPDPAAFANAHPKHAEELLEMLPLLNDLEKAGDAERGKSALRQEEIPELPGTDFKLVRKIGGGGMGVVYEARQLSLDRLVAVKLLAPSLVENAARRGQFEHEARIIARLRHPNLVQVIAAGQSAGVCYFVMGLVDGERLDRHTFANVREIADVGLQVARALAYAHGNQVMHRDIKPSNIMLDSNVVARVTDFGLACVLEAGRDSVERAGAQNGTLRYMSPERLLYGISSFAGDQYALGVTLYELVTRHPILSERSPNALFRRICKAPLPPLVCAEEPDFAAIVNKCISFDAANRYASMADLAEDLRRFLDHEPVLAAPPRMRHRFALWVRRSPTIATLTGVACVCAIAAVTALAIGYMRTTAALERAELNAQLAGSALSGVFARIEKQPVTKRDTELLNELLPYYEELTLRRDLPPEKIVEANRVLGTCALRTGNYQLAERAFRQIIESTSDAKTRILLANALRRQGKDSEADALFREISEGYYRSPYAEDQFAAIQAIRELSVDNPKTADLARAFELAADLIRIEPGNPDYRYQFASILALAPELGSGTNGLPRVKATPIQMLNRLVKEHPERPEFGTALADLVDQRLQTSGRHLRGEERRDINTAIELADQMLARYANQPDVVSSVLRLRVSFVAFLRRVNDLLTADRESARTMGMLEMIASNTEPPDAQRFRFVSTNGVAVAYRQISINRNQRGPNTLILIQHGRDGVGTDNTRQLYTPSLLPLVEYIQTHDEKALILLPQCPPKKTWKQLRSAINELTQRKLREFRVPPKRVFDVGEAPLSEDECVGIFHRPVAD